MGKLSGKVRGFADRVKKALNDAEDMVDRGTVKYKEKVDALMPTVQATPSDNMWLMVGAVLLGLFLIFKRK